LRVAGYNNDVDEQHHDRVRSSISGIPGIGSFCGDFEATTQQMFWADAVERSRTERLGRARASNIRTSIELDKKNNDLIHTKASKEAAEAFMKPLDRIEVEEPLNEISSLLPEESALSSVQSLAYSNFVFSVGQQVDAVAALTPPTFPAKTDHIWQNATVLDVSPSKGVLVGYRLYHNSGPYTEYRGNQKNASRHAKEAYSFAKRCFTSNGEYPPIRYFGLSQDDDQWIHFDQVVDLSTRSTNLLDNMNTKFKRSIMGSLSRLKLRRSREMSGDIDGAISMDRAMMAYQDKDHGPLHYYSKPSKTRYNKWRSKLSPSKPIQPIYQPNYELQEKPENNDKDEQQGQLVNDDDNVLRNDGSSIVENTDDGKITIESSSMMEINFVPSLIFTGDIPGYSYELQARGLGYYTKPYKIPENEKGKREQREIQIRNLNRELEACLLLKEEEEEKDEENPGRLNSINERECDIRLQLAMLIRLNVEDMWKLENRINPPLEDEHQSGPSGKKAIQFIKDALALLRGILLIQPDHSSARLNSIELVGMLPIVVRSEMYGGSFTFDNVFSANPNVYPPFVSKRVPRSKFNDQTYRLYTSYGGHGILPSNAWLNIIIRLPGETKDRLISRANRIVLPIQRCYRKRWEWRSHGSVQFQKIYRGHRVRLAVVRKIQRETYCCTIIFAL
jgi:hypothetical protein